VSRLFVISFHGSEESTVIAALASLDRDEFSNNKLLKSDGVCLGMSLRISLHHGLGIYF